ncbi:lytic transglycosylase domain-containing protein [Daejeonella sp.]|uniref:lytic transglycosylase domain-containing protein n=1 Tax=Daejeonella sp. TaxID=2805397 RepID=UPI0025C00DCA|nr:lytic transglycosylase domain-containing protein [Daejeonella sp.]
MLKTVFSLLFLFSLSCGILTASEKDSLIVFDANHLNINKLQLNQDSIPKSVFIGNPIVPLSNGIFQTRLESIRKEVDLSYNEHVQKYIDTYLKRKEHIGKMLGLSKYYFPIFEKALKEFGLPDELKYITVVESALNPNAVSRSGAVGPWQFMYTTAKGYGLTMDSYTDERKDPQKASLAAAQYLSDAHKRIGDWLLAIAAFNCGTGAVTRAIAKSGGVADFWKVRPFLPLQTQNYVPAFIATVYTMSYHQAHEIAEKPADFSTSTDIFPVTKRISISSIAKATELDVNELLMLNPSYKKQIINGSNLLPMPLVVPSLASASYSSLYELFNGQDEDTTANLSISANPENKSKIGQKNNENSYFQYIVKAGDTLSGIAGKFKGTTVSGIKVLNGLKSTVLKPGMRLKIPKI